MPLSQPTTTVRPSRKPRGACHGHLHAGPDNLYRRCRLACPVGACEGLGADTRRLRRQDDSYGSLFYGHVPFVAGDVPVEFVVIREKFQPVSHAILQDERTGGIGRAGNPDPDVPVMPLPVAFECERSALLVGDGDSIQQKTVIETLRGLIFDGNQALDSVPCPFEPGADGLRHQQVAAGQDLEFNVEPAEHERAGCRREELAEGKQTEQGDDEQVRGMPRSLPGARLWTGGWAHARTAPWVARAGLCP
jgi:hypothetical protein